MAKKSKKKKVGTKKSKTGISFTPFSMIRRVNDLSKLEGKAERTPFEMQTHGLITAFEFLNLRNSGEIDTSASSRIGLQPYLNQYVGVAGRITDVRRTKDGVSLLILDPSLVGTFGNRKKSEVKRLVKEANGKDSKYFQDIPNQPIFSSHVWLFIPEVDASLFKEKALYLGSVVTFYAKVELYKGRVSTSHSKKAPKYGLGSIILNTSYMPYMVQKMDESKFKQARSGRRIQMMFGNYRLGSVNDFDLRYAVALIEGSKLEPNVDWYFKIRGLGQKAHWNWIYNFMMDCDPEVERGLIKYTNFKPLMLKNKLTLPIELEVLRRRKSLRDTAVSEGLLADYDKLITEIDLFCNYSDCADYLESNFGFTNIPMKDYI